MNKFEKINYCIITIKFIILINILISYFLYYICIFIYQWHGSYLFFPKDYLHYGQLCSTSLHSSQQSTNKNPKTVNSNTTIMIIAPFPIYVSIDDFP